jgi:hypothetical protein
LLGLPEFKYSTTPEPVDYLAGQGAVEPIFGPFDIIPDAVKKMTGSDLAAFVSGFLSPKSLLKRNPSTLNLNKGDVVYRAVENPVPFGTSRRFDHPGDQFGTHVTVDPETARYIISEGGYTTDKFYKMFSNVGKPLVVSDGDWTLDRLIPRILKENPGAFSKGGEKALLRLMNRYEKAYRNSFADELPALQDQYAKAVQRVLQREGFDHISYINSVEGTPSESAILFNEGAHTRPSLVK